MHLQLRVRSEVDVQLLDAVFRKVAFGHAYLCALVARVCGFNFCRHHFLRGAMQLNRAQRI